MTWDWESEKVTRREREAAEQGARRAQRGAERMARLVEQEAWREARRAREAARERARAAELAARAPSFTKRGELWLIRGADLEEGQTVTVGKRDGSLEDVVVGKVVEVIGGRQLATYSRVA